MNVIACPPHQWPYLHQLMTARLQGELQAAEPDSDRIAQVRQALLQLDELLTPAAVSTP